MAELKIIDGDNCLEFTIQATQPKKLIVNGPATIILWDDGTKTVAKCSKDEPFDPEKGVAIAIAKKFVSMTKLHRMFDDALSQISDSGKSPLEQWLETIRIAVGVYGSSAGGDKK